MNAPDPREFELRAAILFLLLLLLLLGVYADRKQRENKSLKEGMTLLEANLEETRKEQLFCLDSLQRLVQEEERANLRLKDSLRLLEGERNRINKRTDEKKAAIHRIAAVDSLYREVAGHYR